MKIMKAIPNFILTAALCCSCASSVNNMQGTLSVSFSALGTVLSKAGKSEIPDTNSFILTVESSSGDIIYNGEFCAAPESWSLDPGTYTVSAVSCDFVIPAFDSPQWGDSILVIVPAGQSVRAELLCRQLNCGVRLSIDSNFLTDYPRSAFFVKSADGKLMYSYSEKRTAYFRPGLISLMMTTGSTDEILLTRQLDRGEILDLDIRTSGKAGMQETGGSGISIAVDTSRTYIDETYILGVTGRKGDDEDNPMSVSQARSSSGAEDVWVEGYIVAGDLSKNNASFSGPFTSRTNLAIGPRKSTASKDQCLSVELKSGKVRDALNLVDNPQLLGKRVVLKGDIEAAYFGIPGIKNITDFRIR